MASSIAGKVEAALAKEGIKDLSDQELRRFAASVGKDAIDTLESSALARKFKDFVGSKTAPLGSAVMATKNLPAVTPGAAVSKFDKPLSVTGTYSDPSTAVVPAGTVRDSGPGIIDAEFSQAGRGASGSWGKPIGAAAAAGALGAASAIGKDPQASGAGDPSMLPADFQKPTEATENSPGSVVAASKESVSTTPPQPQAETYSPKLVDPSVVKQPAKITPPKYDDTQARLDEEAKRFGEGYGAKLSSEDQTALNEWNKRREALNADYAAAKERLGWGEAAEIFGKALARIGAGLYGIKTGVDVSGAKFDPSDWSSRYDRAQGDYKIALDQAEKATQSKRDSIESLRKEFGDYQNRRSKLEFQKGSDKIAVDKANQDSTEAYNRALLDLAKSNIGETNEALKANAKARNDFVEAKLKMEADRLKADTKLSPEEKIRFEGASDGYKKALDRYAIGVQNIAKAKSLVGAIGTLPSSKKASNIAAAAKLVDSNMVGGRDLWAEAEKEAKWDPLVAPEDVYVKLLDEATDPKKNPNPPPTVEEYMKAAGLKPSTETASTTKPRVVTPEELAAYAEQYKMTPEAAKQYLQSQGKTVQ